LLDDAPTFRLEGVSGTATLVDVDELVGVNGAEMERAGEAIFSGAALLARTGHSSSDVWSNIIGTS
jgi:hypothetical protein